MSADKLCLRPGCGRHVYARGLCGRCYYAAARIVKSGAASFKDLETAGKCLPLARSIRPMSEIKAWLLDMGGAK